MNMKSTKHSSARFMMAILSCSLALPALAQESQPELKADPNLPSGKEIVNQAIETMGSAEAFDAIKSMSVTGTMDIPMMGMSMDIEMHSAPQGKFLFKQIIPGMGEISIGSDGDVGWTVDPMSGAYQLIEGDDLEQGMRQANIQKIISSIPDRFETLDTIEETSFDDFQTYKVRAVNEEEEQFIYFDIENHLPRGLETSTPEGKVVLKFKDWVEMEGIKYFKTFAIDQGGMQMSMNFKEFKINETDDSLFEQPEEVKELVKAKKDEAPTSQPD